MVFIKYLLSLTSKQLKTDIMRRIKATVKIDLPKQEVFNRKDNSKMFKGVPRKYKYLIMENGKIEGYYESKLHM